MRRLVPVLIGLVMTLVMPTESLPAQEHASGARLDLQLEIAKRSIVLGEPVYATVQLVNLGSTPAEVFRLLDPQMGHVIIALWPPDGGRVVYLPLFHAEAVRSRMSLAPHEVVAAAFPIFYGSRGWTFERPGTYRVAALYRDGREASHEPLQSNTVEVTVAAGHGFGQRLLSAPESEEAGKFLLWQRGDHLTEGQALLAELMKTYPDSPVGDYARLAFGRNLSRSFRHYGLAHVRQADCEAALKYFEELRPERLPEFLRLQQRLDEARCHIRLSDLQRAEASLRQAEELSAGRREFQLLFQQAVRLEPALAQRP